MSTAEERFHAAARELPQTAPRVFQSPANSLEPVYNRYWHVGFWITLLTLGIFGSIFLLSGIYHFASTDETEATRGRGIIRGTIIALILPIILAAIAGILFIIFASAWSYKPSPKITPEAQTYFDQNPNVRPTRATQKKLGLAEVPWKLEEWELWLRRNWKPDTNVSTSDRNAILYKYTRETTREPLDVPENEALIAIEDELFRREAAKLHHLEQAENARRDNMKFDDYGESARESIIRKFEETRK